jgi:hypothetical protein
MSPRRMAKNVCLLSGQLNQQKMLDPGGNDDHTALKDVDWGKKKFAEMAYFSLVARAQAKIRRRDATSIPSPTI